MTDQSSLAASRKTKIRDLNDELRASKGATGMLVVTNGVQARGMEFVDQAVTAVSTFDAFDTDNDPHEEHDFGCLTLHGEKLFFKVDYFDSDLAMHSPDEADPTLTTRVLTIMLASEY